jgi:hypothetical protein
VSRTSCRHADNDNPRMTTLEERLRRMRTHPHACASSSTAACDKYLSSFSTQLYPSSYLRQRWPTVGHCSSGGSNVHRFVPSPTPCFGPASPTVSPMGSPFRSQHEPSLPPATFDCSSASASAPQPRLSTSPCRRGRSRETSSSQDVSEEEDDTERAEYGHRRAAFR